MRCLKYNDAILEATEQLMDIDEKIFIMGLGVPDPKGVFGTTLGLQKKFGSKRVMDMPISENAMTGVAIGAAIQGLRPIMTHQRIDFFLLALDQLVNNAAKWNYIFDDMQVPLVIRLIEGRGWGQGPQHSQSFHSIFTHFPNLTVVMPSNAYDAKGLFVSSVKNNGPVVFIEHRWLHHLTGEVPKEIYEIPFGKAKIIQKGSDITIVTVSQMTIEMKKANVYLQEENISAEIIDLRCLKPLDIDAIVKSLHKTNRLVIIDPSWKTLSIGSEIISLICEKDINLLKCNPLKINFPDQFVPSSWSKSNFYYPTYKDIAVKILNMMGKESKANTLQKEIKEEKLKTPLDLPDNSSIEPF